MRIIFVLTAMLVISVATVGPVVAQVSPFYPPDSSLSLNTYMNLGMPAIDRNWSALDYDRATAIIDSLADIDPTILPRYNSKRSGEVFARMTAAENAKQFMGVGKLIGINQLTALMLSQNRLLQVYLKPAGKGMMLDLELAEIIGTVLKTSSMLIGYVDSLIAQEALPELQSPEAQSGMAQMRSGLGTMLTGALYTLEERNAYRDTSRLFLSRHLVGVVPELYPSLTDQGRMDFRKLIEKVIAEETREDIAALLKELADKIKELDENSQ